MQEPHEPDPAVMRALRDLAEEDGTRRSSAAVEARLRAEVRAIASARRRRIAATVLAAAAAIAVAVSVPLWRSAGTPSPRSVPADSPQPRVEITTAFFPLPYSNVPTASGQLVRVEVPRSTLASFGLEPLDRMALVDSASTVQADVLVGEDGLARSVRFVLPRAGQEQKR